MFHLLRTMAILFCCLAALASLPPVSEGEGSGTRDALSANDLLNDNYPIVVDNRYFMPMGASAPAKHELSGMIQFSEQTMVTTHPDATWLGSGQTIFPSFTLPVISADGHLIPLTREIIYSGAVLNSHWNVIVSPGKVWSEAGDGDFSRASFPFVLTDNKIGQVRNGLATFVYNKSTISGVAIQITQETAPVDSYVTADFHALLDVNYERRTFADRDVLAANYQREREARLPLRPWTDLENGAQTALNFNAGLNPGERSLGALIMDGTIYMLPCETRSGDFPYPEEMRHGVFSVTKTMGLGLAMFYLSQRYGDEIWDEWIVDYVPFLADNPDWWGVTFEHTLGMATGTYGSDSHIGPFIQARSAAEKLAWVNSLPAVPETPPGAVFLYGSHRSFVLSYALNQFVKLMENPRADYWKMFTRDVLQPLGIPYLLVVRTPESDGSSGTPVMGWGSYPTLHEAAKIAWLLRNEGAFGSKQLLDKRRVREALGRTERIGLLTGGGSRYLHSIWRPSVDNGTCMVEAPTMLGHGGNFLLVMDSGICGIRFTDAMDYVVGNLVMPMEQYGSSCPE